MTVGLSSEVCLLPIMNLIKFGDFVVISGKKRLFLKVLMAGVAMNRALWGILFCFLFFVIKNKQNRIPKIERFV